MSATANLSNIPFESLIGGPMEAAIRAQSLAAQTSIEFIQAIGFNPPPAGSTTPSQDVRNVTFKYTKVDDGTDKNFVLTVPVLSIVPIPYLRIDQMTIDFTARLSDVVTTDRSSEVNWGVSAAYTGKRIQLRAGASGTHKMQYKSQSTAEYTMDIHVVAKQDEMPKGLARIIDILETVITEKQQTP